MASVVKILFVDDEPDILEQAKTSLEKEDDRLSVDTAASARKGLEQINKHSYDAIVSEYGITDADGSDFLKIVKDERGIDIPFIIFTSKGREEAAIKALNLGVDRYIRKGEDPQSKYSTLAKAINQEVNSKTEYKTENLESEIASIVRKSEDSIYIVDEDCRFIFANEKELERHGVKQEKIVGAKFSDLHPEKESEEFEKKAKKVLETGEPIRQEIKSKEKDEYYVRTLSPIKNPKTGKLDRVSVFSKNITEQKMEENRFERMNHVQTARWRLNQIISKESDFEKILEDAVEIISDIEFCWAVSIVLKNSDGHLQVVSQKSERGKEDWNPDEGDGNVASCIREVAKHKTKKIIDRAPDQCGECTFCEKDSPHKTIVVPIVSNLELIGVLKVVFEEDFSFENEIFYIEEIAGDLSFAWDKVRSEDRRKFLHELLRHDVLNKAQIVKGYLQFLEDEEVSREGKKYLDKSLNGTDEIIELIEKIRTLREAEEERTKKIDISAKIDEVIDNTKGQAAEKGIEIVKEVPEDCTVKAGPLIERVFSNIIENALQHSQGSKIKITGKREEEEVIFTIEDDGRGISDEDKKKIFRKHYTTDEERGTGLGMFLVETLIERYNGKIEVKDSELGGAKFVIHLQKV